ncbi:DNA-directed RNA polymerase subunit alpha-like [Cryptomeria japonica]|uniref:DNA-directed RNA polymerase subunit alpha-like n=1 Tax=Cryptomeria japonica TaxID=3369 RepID=UPI0027DA6249|nr:DNA-directed RNA polymerase subunit alpha-like [Cryptomeria japonica]
MENDKENYNSNFCTQCGVELAIDPRIRRYQMGYIKLACPVVHIWPTAKKPTLLRFQALRPSKYESWAEKIAYYLSWDFGLVQEREIATGVDFKYSVIIGIEESIHEILMNLKEIVLRSDAYGIREGSIHVVGPKKVTAQDIMLPPFMRIIDTTQHIANINKSITLDISLQIEKGRRYIIQNPNNYNPKDEIFAIDAAFVFPIDAAFAPVQNVNYSIHSYWSENETQEILFLEIWTNGGLAPKEALYEASQNLIDFFLPFLNAKEENNDGTNSLSDDITPSLPILHISTDTKRIAFDQMYIDQLNFSTRVYNCLKKANINTVSDLLNYSREDLMKIKHLGEQSVKEILEFIRNIQIDSPGNPV